MKIFFKKWLMRGVWAVSIVVLVIAGALLLSARFSIPGGYRLYAVLSGSMAPGIPVGSLVITSMPHGTIPAGTIITFEEAESKRLITHRVIQVTENNTFITKGDANQTADIAPVPYLKIRGIYKTHLPYAGSILEFIKSPLGLIICISIPALIIIFEELQAIIHVLVEKKTRLFKTTSLQEPLPFIDSIQAMHRLPRERQPHKIRVTMLMLAATALCLAVSPSYASFTANPVIMMHSMLGTAGGFIIPIPSPTPTTCDDDIIIEQENSNTAPHSINKNEASVSRNCSTTITHTTHSLTIINR